MSYYIERIVHFNCESCRKCWSIEDADIEHKHVWCCPHCGVSDYHKNSEDSLLMEW